jgi:hypothetical protein
MRSLRDCLKALYDSAEDLDPELGVQIIVLAVKLTRDQAFRWIEVFGNPLVDPSASSVFCLAVGLNPEVIKHACLDSHRHNEPMNDVLLAASMTKMTLEALIAFPASDGVRH